MAKFKRTLSGFLLVLITLIFAGCSLLESEDASPPRNPALVDAIANDLVFRDVSFSTDPDKAECVGEEVFEQIGAARLAAAGITVAAPDPRAGDLSPADAALVDEILESCLGRVALLLEDAADPGSAADSDSADSEIVPAVQEMVAELMDDGMTDDPAEAQCVVDVLYGYYGSERFAALADSEVMNADDAEVFIETMDGCMDLEEMFVRLMTEPPDPVPVDVAECAARKFGESGVRQMFSEGFTTEAEDARASVELENQLIDAFEACS